MPRACTVCQHPAREAIDQALITGQAFRRIASQFDLSEISLRRHKQAHLPQVLARGLPVEALASADDLRAKLRRYETKCWTILQHAEIQGWYLVALACLRELRGLLTLHLQARRLLEREHAEDLQRNIRDYTAHLAREEGLDAEELLTRAEELARKYEGWKRRNGHDLHQAEEW